MSEPQPETTPETAAVPVPTDGPQLPVQPVPPEEGPQAPASPEQKQAEIAEVAPSTPPSAQEQAPQTGPYRYDPASEDESVPLAERVKQAVQRWLHAGSHDHTEDRVRHLLAEHFDLDRPGVPAVTEPAATEPTGVEPVAEPPQE